MIFVALIVSFGLLFKAADVSSATKHQMNHVTQRDNKTPVDNITASNNCRRHVHFNNFYQYYSQPTSVIKAKLGKVENQLDDIQKKIESLVALVNSSLSKLTISKSNDTEEQPTPVTPLGTGGYLRVEINLYPKKNAAENEGGFRQLIIIEIRLVQCAGTGFCFVGTRHFNTKYYISQKSCGTFI